MKCVKIGSRPLRCYTYIPQGQDSFDQISGVYEIANYPKDYFPSHEILSQNYLSCRMQSMRKPSECQTKPANFENVRQFISVSLSKVPSERVIFGPNLLRAYVYILAFEMRCYRKLLNISNKDHVTNEEVRKRIQIAIAVHDDLLTMVKKRNSDGMASSQDPLA